MFEIETRLLKTDGNYGPWFPIWTSEDGADSARYLKQLIELDYNLSALPNKQPRQYHMIFNLEKK